MLAISLFDNTFEKSIIMDIVGGTRSFVNGSKEENRGIENEFSTQIGKRWHNMGVLVLMLETKFGD